MLPGFVSGFYTYEDCHIDLGRLCRYAGASLVQREATGIDIQVTSSHTMQMPTACRCCWRPAVTSAAGPPLNLPVHGACDSSPSCRTGKCCCLVETACHMMCCPSTSASPPQPAACQAQHSTPRRSSPSTSGLLLAVAVAVAAALHSWRTCNSQMPTHAL